MEQNIKDILERIILNRQGVIIKPDISSNLVDDLGLDSLDHVLLWCAIEEAFLIKIPKEYSTHKFDTVQDIIDVANKVKEERYGQDTGKV